MSCLNCSLVGDISISGGDKSTPPDANFTVIPSSFDFTDVWAGVAVDSFAMHVEFEVELTPGPNNGSSEIVVHLLGSPQTLGEKEVGYRDHIRRFSYILQGPLGLTVTFDPQLHGTITTSKAVNFTYGFDIIVPPGSAILIPLLHEDQAVLLGL